MKNSEQAGHCILTTQTQKLSSKIKAQFKSRKFIVHS